MAVLYITEFDNFGEDMKGLDGITMARQVPLVEQTVAIAAGSAQSAALNANTRIVRLHTDAICSVLFGANPTATATKMRLAANATEYFTVPTNSSLKVAVITNT